ncbi:MAG: hypothetical protein ACI9LN_001748 [Saprospiraceae bacterium]|jgi:hypothetical protein
MRQIKILNLPYFVEIFSYGLLGKYNIYVLFTNNLPKNYLIKVTMRLAFDYSTKAFDWVHFKNAYSISRIL